MLHGASNQRGERDEAEADAPTPTPKPEATNPRDAGAAPELPVAIDEWRAQLQAARVQPPDASANKKCRLCGIDVALDPFRMKGDAGYTCSDCQDAIFRRSFVRQTLMRRLVYALSALLVLSIVAGGVLYFFSTSSKPKASFGSRPYP
jgi:hypothetical protein